VRVNNLTMARKAALSGLGIVNLPAFACAADIEGGRLAPVLDDLVAPFGAINLVYPSRRFLPLRVRLFVEAATAHLRSLPELSGPAPGKKPGAPEPGRPSKRLERRK
jgi:DNA-binding transcriptional LysR family regulator